MTEFASFQKTIAAIHQVLPSSNLSFYIDSNFSSQNKNHRLLIRQHLVKTQAHCINSAEEKENILNLDLLPQLKSVYISISHNSEFGGYVVSPQPIGFDLELLTRIKKNIVERVCTNEDILKCPRYEYLWGAKEACFKLISQNPDIFAPISALSEINDLVWSKVDDDLYQFFTTYKSRKIQGLIGVEQNILFSISVSI